MEKDIELINRRSDVKQIHKGWHYVQPLRIPTGRFCRQGKLPFFIFFINFFLHSSKNFKKKITTSINNTYLITLKKKRRKRRDYQEICSESTFGIPSISQRRKNSLTWKKEKRKKGSWVKWVYKPKRTHFIYSSFERNQ